MLCSKFYIRQKVATCFLVKTDYNISEGQRNIHSRQFNLENSVYITSQSSSDIAPKVDAGTPFTVLKEFYFILGIYIFDLTKLAVWPSNCCKKHKVMYIKIVRSHLPYGLGILPVRLRRSNHSSSTKDEEVELLISLSSRLHWLSIYAYHFNYRWLLLRFYGRWPRDVVSTNRNRIYCSTDVPCPLAWY